MTRVVVPLDDPSNRMQHWLEGDGGRVLIRQSGLLVGRSAECEVVVSDARVSRHHLLLRPTEDGVEMMVLGRAPVTVNAAPVRASATLRHGDAITLSGRTFRVVSAAAPRPAEPSCVWGVEPRGGAFFRVAHSPFSVGGDARDDLQVASWPPATLTLTTVQRALVLETGQSGVVCDGAVLAESEVVSVRPGAVVRFLGQELRLIAAPESAETATAPSEGDSLPRRVRLEFLPRGGRLTLSYGAWERTLWLADRRCDLVATLLFPPAPYAAGDPVPDDVLLPRVWPDGKAGRVELNTLLFRTRKDLVRADVDGAALLERLDNSTRFRLAHGADVAIVEAP